ncbi:hypothetical protein Bca101_074695 [Brassica carinata]
MRKLPIRCVDQLLSTLSLALSLLGKMMKLGFLVNRFSSYKHLESFQHSVRKQVSAGFPKQSHPCLSARQGYHHHIAEQRKRRTGSSCNGRQA